MPASTAGADLQRSRPLTLTHPKYRPDIDGLRALGVLLVLVFHAFPQTLPGGFVGVDIFFVVSGYLISTILFGNLENGSFSLAEFYRRRIRRIFPALIVVLTSCWVLGWFVLLLDEHRQLGLHLVAGAGFFSNLVLWREAGYFDSDAYTKPLLHLWSLGIEEQFYILWPLLLVLVWQRRHKLLGITLVIAVASFAVNLHLTAANPVAAFYAPWSRFWELMSGGVLAYLTLHRSTCLTARPNGQSAVGLFLILLGVALLNKRAAFPGWWALLPTLGTCLVIAAGPDAWLNRKCLGSRGMVAIGLISYPLYLWHWPLLSLAWIISGRMPPTGTRMLLVGLSFLLAWLTYRFVERPLRAGGQRTAMRLVGGMSVVLLIGLASHAQWLRPRHDDAAIGPIIEAIDDWEYPSGLQKTIFAGTPGRTKRAGAQTVLFIGDSHLEQYSPRVVSLLEAGAKRSVLFLTSPGCAPIPGSGQTNRYHVATCNVFRQQLKQLVEHPEIASVVIGGAWNLYFLESASPEAEHLDLDLEFARLAQFIQSIAARKKVYFVLDNPSGAQFEPRHFFAGSRLTQFTIKPFATQVPFDPAQDALRRRLALIASAAGATVLDPVSGLCRENHCPVVSAAGKPIYKDGNHYRPFFVREHADFIDVTLQD